jgi:hypothetical protein
LVWLPQQLKISLLQREGSMSINAINTNIKKRRSFVALLFAAGYGQRYLDLL